MRGARFFLLLSGLVGLALLPAQASSHREAPLISADPQVDSTDVWAFVSPDRQDSVTLISSWLPFEEPAGGPNFYKFADGVWYDLNVDVDGNAQPDWVYRWIFRSETRNGNTFLNGFNVHSMAVQIPKAALRRSATSPVVGVWTTASRPGTKVYNPDGTQTNSGNFVQVSRLGMPLVNEVVIPLAQKDKFSASKPVDDAQFLSFVQNSELASLLNLIYRVPAPSTPRNDLVSVFLTGVPNLNQPPGVRPSEMLRLNIDTPVNPRPQRLGVLDGDLQGFPNGRRLTDDIVDIEVQVVAGELVGAPNNLGDGVDGNDVPFLASFPYLGIAQSGAKSVPHRY